MKRTRVLLLGLMVALLALATQTNAKAAVCIPCICAKGCFLTEERCKVACKGNKTCDNNCASAYSDCLANCNQ